MESKVNFAPYQELTTVDMTAMQDGVQASMKTVVKHLLFDEGAYCDLVVTADGPQSVAVGTGYYVVDGDVFPKAAVTQHSLVPYLPSSETRIVLALVQGQEVDTAEEPRMFLINATTMESQPRPTATRRVRSAVITLVAGPEGVDPTRPAVPAGALVIAALLIGPTGLVGDPVAESANEAWSLERAVGVITGLVAAQQRDEAMFATLRSDLAALAERLRDTVSSQALMAAIAELAILRQQAGIPDTATLAGFDDFSDDEESDTAFAGYNAIVDGGHMRFGQAARTPKLTALLNPIDPKLDKSVSGLVLPAADALVRVECKDKDGEVAISSYSVGATELKKQTLTRVYHYYAARQPHAQLEAQLLSKASIKVYDPEDDTYKTLPLTGRKWTLIPRSSDRLPGDSPYWKIKVSEPYWSVGETVETVNGSRVAQTFLVAHAGWYKRLDLGLTDKAATGDVHIALCHLTNAGTPDLARVVARSTVAAAGLKKWPAWTPFEFDPTFLQAGVRYAVVVVTQGAHKLGVSKSNAVTNGTLLASTDGVYWQGDLQKDACFRLVACRFKTSGVIVDLEAIELAGGIRQLQVAFTAFEPSGTDLVLQAQVGGVWRTIGEEDATVFASAPTLVPLRLVFKGTVDLMPALALAKSRVIASSPTTPTVHVSKVRSLPAGTTTEVTVTEDAISFDAAIHGWDVHVLTGAGYATATTAVPVTTALPNGRTRRTWKVTIPASASYRIRSTLTTSNLARTFAVISRKDVAV